MFCFCFTLSSVERAQKTVLPWKRSFLLTKGTVHGQVLCRQKDPVPAPAGRRDAFRGLVTAGGRRGVWTMVMPS